MYSTLKLSLAMAAAVASGYASAQVTLYGQENYQGRSFSTGNSVTDLNQSNFRNRASSAIVKGRRFEVCDDVGFTGRCFILSPGNYPSLNAVGLNDTIASVRPVRGQAVDESRLAPTPGQPGITFYGREGFQGRTFTTNRRVGDLERVGFNDRASSAVVVGDRFEVCSEPAFAGRCVVLRPGNYASLTAMGLDNSVSSVRNVDRAARIEDRRYAPPPVTTYDARPRDNERIFDARVTSVRAVVGPPEQRCWVEREQVSNTNSGEALAGAVIGAILGHQVGGREINRCENVTNQGRPHHWDVTYTFNGREHTAQMISPPGETIRVNARGEPRV